MIAQTIEITFTNSNLHAYSHFVCIKQCRQCHNDIACEYTLKIYVFTKTTSEYCAYKNQVCGTY